jgi:hypothetical protein
LNYSIGRWYPGQLLDLQRIWLKQRCPDILQQQIAILAKKVYHTITADTRPIENVTQWCKQAGCWESVKGISVTPITGFEALLSDREEHVSAQREARQIRKIENTIDKQTAVLELGEEYWKRLEIWLRSNRLATEAELRALKYATSFSQGTFPSEIQCKSLLNLREKAVGEGFPQK